MIVAKYFLLFLIFLISNKTDCINAKKVNKKKIAITNMKRDDGFGAHVQQIIGAALYAELNGYYFFYRPFKKMEHNYSGKANDPEFIVKHEKLINLIGNFPTFKDAKKRGYKIKTKPYDAFLDAHINRITQSPIINKIKEAFRANKQKPKYFAPNFLNIAIHIRRSNQHDHRIYGTDVPNDIYMEIIKKLRDVYSGQNLLFHIFSQGDLNNFIELEALDTLLHIDEPVEDTYTALVLADILVVGRSSFSYTAGYLSDGIVYYISYMHKPLINWISIEEMLGKKVLGVGTDK